MQCKQKLMTLKRLTLVQNRGFLSLKFSFFGCNVARVFPARAASILFFSIFGHKIGVLESPALFQGKELQVTRFKVTCF